METFIWRHYHFELPDDWELLQFTRNPQTGRCSFADRRQFRFELNWRVVGSAPDFDRMLTDYQGRLESDGLTDLRRLEHSDWKGVSGEQDGRLTTRYGHFFPEDGSLVEVVFLWPKGRDVVLERQILESFSFVPAADGFIRWRAFGLDLRASDTHELWKASVRPGTVELKFTAQKGYREQRFGRYGMIEEWLAGTPGTWLKTQIPKGFKILTETRHTRQSHEIFTINGLRSFPQVKNIIRGRREIKASAWICPQDKRLYSLLLVSTGRVVDLESRIGLRCCDHNEVNP